MVIVKILKTDCAYFQHFSFAALELFNLHILGAHSRSGAHLGYVPPPMIFNLLNDPAVTPVSFSTLNLNVNVDMDI